MLQILLRITEAVMQKPKDSQVKDTFAQSMSGLLFRVSVWGFGWWVGVFWGFVLLFHDDDL